MTQGQYTIISNRPIAAATWEMLLAGDTSALTRPGQFVNLRTGGHYLRRPLSVCAWDDSRLTLIYKVVGQGTDWLSERQAGDPIDMLCGLGNGFDTGLSGQHPLLIGGGVGLPPLYQLARQLVQEGKQPRLIMGFNSMQEVFYREEFERLMPVTVTTMDGSCGLRGLVTEVPPEANCTYFYACGPSPMLRALCGCLAMPGQLSLEERMGCGFGACMGCTIRTRLGDKRVCKEGPVFFKEELIW